MSFRSIRMMNMARKIAAENVTSSAMPISSVADTLLESKNSQNSLTDPQSRDSYSETDVSKQSINIEMQSNVARSINSNQIISDLLQHNENHNDSSSNENINESFDDSDIDPDFIPPKFSVTTSSDDELSDLSEIAATIERNLCSEHESHIANININKPSTSSAAVNSDLVDQNEWLKQTVIPKSKKGKSKERFCKPLDKCQMKCRTKITYDEQKTIFKKYWELTSYTSRALYVSGLMEVRGKKRVTLLKSTTAPRNRTHSYIYSLELNGLRITVCQKCFLYTLGETVSYIKTIGKKMIINSFYNTVVENRGKRIPVNKLSDCQIEEVIAHINKFPAYESHYTRNRSSKKYLQCDLNLLKMYKLYAEEHERPISITKYSEIFKGLGLSFKKPKTDTCSKCDTFKLQIDVAKTAEEKNKISALQTQHLNDADIAYKSKDNDKSIARMNSKTKLYTFDLEKCLPTPLLYSNISFYKRQLWTYNLTVHDCISNQPYCYMWHEGEAKRGGNEVASCLLEHLLLESPDTENIIFYSDCCSGQNKNSFVSIMFMMFLQNKTNVTTIDHKFLLPGHTHMECDVDHSAIE